MNNYLNKKLSREQINELPLVKWQGPTHLIKSEEEANQIIPQIAYEPVLGFDTETRPVFKKGQYNSPSLLQLATSSDVFILSLKQTGLPKSILEIFENKAIQKTGVAIKDDLKELCALEIFTPQGFTDLTTMSKKLKMRHHGLRGMAAAALGVRISKSQRTTNWAKKNLSNSQILYAATDAWISRELYLHLLKQSSLITSLS